MTVSVVDEAGRPVLIAPGDGAGFFSADTSRAKAVAAVAFRRETKDLGEMALEGSAFWAVVPAVLRDEALPSIGAGPLMGGGR